MQTCHVYRAAYSPNQFPLTDFKGLELRARPRAPRTVGEFFRTTQWTHADIETPDGRMVRFCEDGHVYEFTRDGIAYEWFPRPTLDEAVNGHDPEYPGCYQFYRDGTITLKMKGNYYYWPAWNDGKPTEGTIVAPEPDDGFSEDWDDDDDGPVDPMTAPCDMCGRNPCLCDRIASGHWSDLESDDE